MLIVGLDGTNHDVTADERRYLQVLYSLPEPPSYVELGDVLGTSFGTVFRRSNDLEERGYITRSRKSTTRSLRLTSKALDLLGVTPCSHCGSTKPGAQDVHDA